ncbi:MAG TPA: hypothetical protein PLH18_02050, partial [Clostridia bacterium]|nr:hypothetical protein [Clostridia bacterium]
MFYIIPVLLDILKYFVLYILHLGGMDGKTARTNALWFGGVFFITKMVPFFFLPDENLISIV